MPLGLMAADSMLLRIREKPFDTTSLQPEEIKDDTLEHRVPCWSARTGRPALLGINSSLGPEL